LKINRAAKSQISTVQKGDDNAIWIRKIVARDESPASMSRLETKLADLGFDQLMCSSNCKPAVERRGRQNLSPDTLNEVQTVRELLTAVQARR
jgi:hypothetical protein